MARNCQPDFSGHFGLRKGRIIMGRKALLSLLLLGTLGLAGCTGGTFTSTAKSSSITSVSVSCVPTGVQAGKTSQCSVTVAGSGSYSSAVSWSAVSGTITSSGLYTAPSTAPVSGTATIKATSTQDSTKAGTATVTITTSGVGPAVTGVSVVATPSVIGAAQTATCAATVTGTGAFSTGVTWTATGGTITSGGVFTPSGVGTGSCIAHSTQTGYTNVSGSANITVTSASTTITGVTLVCTQTTITDVQTTTCTPTVTGTGSFANTVNVSVSPTSAGTLSATSAVTSGTGVIFTPLNTGAETATITATSTQDSTKFFSVPITVTVSTGGPTCSGMSLGAVGSLNGFVPFPSTAAWNTNIASAPVDPNSAAIIAGFSGSSLHPDFSTIADGSSGIPYVVVDSSTQPLVPINVVAYASDSDVAYAPFPATAPIEGSPAACTGGPNNYIGDQHVLVLDRNRCMLYETFNSTYCSGAWSADSETIWDLKNFEQRPWGWTSADAAGLAIFPGLVRYDEVAAGQIKHAIRFTLSNTKNDAPADTLWSRPVMRQEVHPLQ